MLIFIGLVGISDTSKLTTILFVFTGFGTTSAKEMMFLCTVSGTDAICSHASSTILDHLQVDDEEMECYMLGYLVQTYYDFLQIYNKDIENDKT